MCVVKFDSQEFYHIYNHAIGDDLLFRNNNDYYYFLAKMQRYLEPFCKLSCIACVPIIFIF